MPNLMGRLQIGVLLPLFERERHAGLTARLRRLQRDEGLSAGELETQQVARLRKLLLHAMTTTEFYSQRFRDSGFDPQQLRSVEDLRSVTALRRDDIRSHLDAMCSRNFRPDELRTSATGGTTDSPVPIRRDVESLREKTAAQLRLNAWAGMQPGDKVYRLWGARSDFAENPSWRWRLYDQTLMRNLWAPTSLFNDEMLELYRRQLNEFKPDVIYAYPTPLTLLCEFLENSGQPYHRPKTAISTAEGLSEEQRATSERVLGCKVFEHYGSREFGMIAGECERGNLHVNPLLAVVEFLPVEGAEDEHLHEILITDLTNYGMPLIRYKVNDCVRLDPSRLISCQCGRKFPVLGRIIGRTTDILTLPDGSRVPGVALTNRVLQVCPSLAKIQVVQEALHDFTINYVAGESFDSTSLNELKANLTKFFPAELRWSFNRVEQIERERSGKTRFCISRVGTNSRRPAAEGMRL